MQLLENIQFAIMNRANDLAQRYGFKPYDFVVTLRSLSEDESKVPYQSVLNYDFPFQDHEAGKRRFNTMLKSLGIDDTWKLVGTDKQIIDSLDHALDIAPRPSRRL